MNDLLRAILSKKMLIIMLTGFSSGLPLLLIGSTLQAWMKESGVDLTLIGIFSLVGLPYTLKFLWAPLLDRYVPLHLGRRRSWMLIAQVMLGISIAAIGFSDPLSSPALVALLAFLVAFFSASQDIVLDAYRREFLADEELGLGSSLYINGYRIAMLVAGAGALALSDQVPWKIVYFAMSAFMVVGILTTLFAPEGDSTVAPPRSLREAVVEPFLEYFQRDRALLILVFILLYKLGDTMASAMTTPFILDQGFTKTELAEIGKVFGLASTLLGAFIGGSIIFKIGIARSLWIFGILQAVSTAGFSVLATQGHSIPWLAAVVAFENLSSGMGTSAYAAFMASLTNKQFTATQYALLTSLMGVPRVLASAPTGWLAKSLGWEVFFIACALIAIPGILLLKKVTNVPVK